MIYHRQRRMSRCCWSGVRNDSRGAGKCTRPGAPADRLERGASLRVVRRLTGRLIWIVGDEARLEWHALHLARGAVVIQRNGSYFNVGSLVSDDLAVVFDRLIARGEYLVLGWPSAGGHRRVEITAGGRARYEALLSPGPGIGKRPDRDF